MAAAAAAAGVQQRVERVRVKREKRGFGGN
jgi:hypothetical protein